MTWALQRGSFHTFAHHRVLTYARSQSSAGFLLYDSKRYLGEKKMKFLKLLQRWWHIFCMPRPNAETESIRRLSIKRKVLWRCTENSSWNWQACICPFAEEQPDLLSWRSRRLWHKHKGGNRLLWILYHNFYGRESLLHLTIQEFFAALFFYDCLTNKDTKELHNFLNLKDKEHMELDLLKTTVDKVLRFLIGLMVEPNRRLLQDLLTSLNSS